MAHNHPLRALIEEVLEKAITALGDKSVELVTVDYPESNVRIPLYYVDEIGRKASYCNVDLLILKDDKIKVILEIDEGDFDPLRTCDNYVASSFSQFHIHKDKEDGKRIDMGENVTFLQIIGTPRLIDDLTENRNQLRQIEDIIKSNTRDSSVKDYHLTLGTYDDFRDDKTGLIPYIMKALGIIEREEQHTDSL